MRTERIKGVRKFPRRDRNQQRPVAIDPATADPGALRDAVCKKLSLLPDYERGLFRDRILGVLETSKVNLRQHLMVLGTTATTAEELTAPEIARLVRYVRINEPKAMGELALVIEELLNLRADLARSATASTTVG